MKQKHLLALLAIFMLAQFSCKKPHVDDPGTCMHTVDYWRTHPGEWQTTGFYLGRGGTYTNEQAFAILHTPAKGNALLSLAYQLIALRLNLENNIDCFEVIDAAVTGEDHFLQETDEGDRLPPFGNIYSTSEDARFLAGQLRSINEGRVAASCCDADPED